MQTGFVRNRLRYVRRTPDATKEIADGTLSTGDVGHVDAEGLFFVDGRDDDMIVGGRENVYPLEVETLLTDHPRILDADAVRAHVRDNPARYKVPRDVVFVPELPRHATGKVLRRPLNDETTTGRDIP
ncbi:MAG: hypothetical protein JHC79_01185 [Williamsia sp.]|nr:hypothetical protein [Williamsia sp.]